MIPGLLANRWIKEQDHEQTQLEYYKEHFTSELCQDIVAHLSDAVYYSVHDQKCNSGCPTYCKSKMNRFDAYNGVYLEQLNENLIDKGGFGTVLSGIWHDQEAAFKFVPVGKLMDKLYQEDMQSELEKNIHEYTIQFESEGDSIVLPIGNFRQQTHVRNNDIK